MSVKAALARTTGNVLTWGLRRLAHRPAGNLPGKVALAIDPELIADLRSKLAVGSVVIVGTNGKTSVTNLVADAFEADGRSIICNRTGANLQTGVASALLQGHPAEWGVFESDELWLARTLPQLKAQYVVLLNLFRDQLDRCGEIRVIQDSIAQALKSSPSTTLIYNADDPQCAAIAEVIPNSTIAFGVDEPMGLEQNTVADASMCQRCAGMVSYHWRQYGQLGSYYCETCGFERPALDVAATQVNLGARELSFAVEDRRTHATATLTSPQSTPYLVYNLLAAWTLMEAVGIPTPVFQQAVDAFNPRNGRLQAYTVGSHPVLLNLAKNPTGFNQNLKIVEQDQSPKAVAFFINDQIADGRDISWIWDIDFEELASQPGTVVFAGGQRKNDLQLRLKYAGISAELVEGMEEVFAWMASTPGYKNAPAYAIANYTDLPPVHEELDRLAQRNGEGVALAEAAAPAAAEAAESQATDELEVAESQAAPSQASTSVTADESAVPAEDPVPSAAPDAEQGTDPVRIVHLFPDLLNLYGDGGNVRALAQRLRWRGIPVEVEAVRFEDEVDLTQADLVFLGGAPDREQRLASQRVMAMKDELAAYVEADGVLLAICGGYQMLGRIWLLGDDEVEGLGILPMETKRPGTARERLVDNMVLASPLATRPVVAYENHAGRTYLDAGVEPFGTVLSSVGCGNSEESHADGARYRNVLGTYGHGPLLPKNPEVADWLLTQALERHSQRTGTAFAPLAPLDDSVEWAANDVMVQRLGVKSEA